MRPGPSSRENRLILDQGTWIGRGSYRPTDETLGINFEAKLVVTEDEQGLLVDIELEQEAGGRTEWNVWIVADEYGTYNVSARGEGLDVSGIAKLESVPHLGLLWSDDGERHVTFSIFALRDSYGIRGFLHDPSNVLTWELALQPQQQAVSGDNVVSFDRRRRR